jgi:hypothetical protein
MRMRAAHTSTSNAFIEKIENSARYTGAVAQSTCARRRAQRPPPSSRAASATRSTVPAAASADSRRAAR